MPTCPHCDVDLVAFAVPEPMREHAPDDAAAATICPRCLRVAPLEPTASADADPEFGRIDDAFPGGEGGVAVALLLAALPKLTLNRDAVAALREAAEVAGVDVALTLDRLVGADLDPHFDLERRVRQLGSLLDG